MIEKLNESNYVVSSKSFTAVAVNTAAMAGEFIKSKLGDQRILITSILPMI